MGFDRMRIPLIRSLSGSVLGERSRRAKSKSRSRRESSIGASTNDQSQTQSQAHLAPPTTASSTATAATFNTQTATTSTTDLRPPSPVPPVPPIPQNVIQAYVEPPIMLRKIWVKRPGASATRVEVSEEDLVDNVRDAILNKYANSLGRHIDSPDVNLRIVTRDSNSKATASERALGPEEPIGRTLDDHFPNGQTIEDALIIDTKNRTPRPSPRPGNHQIQYYVPNDYRPEEGARDYFGPMPPVGSPHLAHVQHVPGHPHSMAILNTGQLPPLPSPGGHSSRRRPKYGRQHTSSPTILHSSQPNGGLIGQ